MPHIVRAAQQNPAHFNPAYNHPINTIKEYYWEGFLTIVVSNAVEKLHHKPADRRCNPQFPHISS